MSLTTETDLYSNGAISDTEVYTMESVAPVSCAAAALIRSWKALTLRLIHLRNRGENMIKKYKYNIEEFKLITCVADFLGRVEGLTRDMEFHKASILDVYMNADNCYKLLVYMQNRVNKYSPEKKGWDAKCRYDWIERSPNVSNKAVPEDELWLVVGDQEEVRE